MTSPDLPVPEPSRSPAPWSAAPAPALAAGVLGLISGTVALAIGGVLALISLSVMEGDGVAGAVLFIALPAAHVTGAILVLCRRAPWLLVVTGLPIVGVGSLALLVLPFPSTAPGPVVLFPLLAAGAAAGASITFSLSAEVRMRIVTRSAPPPVLPAVSRWP